MSKAVRFWPSDDGRLTILPGAWSLSCLKDPEDSIRESLIIYHDMEGNGDDCQDEREILLEFSDGLKSRSVLNRSSEGSVIFKVMIANVPMGMRQEISDRPSLNEILEKTWDTLADCTVDTDWMHSWYATKIEIKPWLGSEDQIVVYCVLADAENKS